MLKLENIAKSFKNVNVLKNVNVTFNNQSFNVLVGKSGSGKTTLLNIIGGLDKPTSGTIFHDETTIDNKNIDSYRNTIVGIVFQQLNLIEDFTIKQNLKLAFDLTNKQMTSENIADVLSKVNLPDDGETTEELLAKKPNQLSVGQKQRLAIARALIKDPQILLLDEPTSALDDDNAESIVSLLKELSKSCIIVVSTHARSIFDKVADQIVELKEKTAIIVKNNAKIKDFSKNEQKYKKGFLSFFETFKFAISNLKYKKIRLATSFLITLISTILFGAAYLIYTCDTNSVLLKTQLDNEISTSSIVKYLDYYTHESDFVQTRVDEFTNDEVERINEHTNGAYLKLSSSDISIRLLDSYGDIDNALIYRNLSELYKAKIDQTTASYFGFSPYDGVSSKTSRLPEQEGEIVISRMLAEALASRDFSVDYNNIYNDAIYNIDSIDELIGMEFHGYTIVGIYSMDDDMFDFWKPYISLSYEDEINDPDLDYDYLQAAAYGFSISQCIFEYSESDTNSHQYLVKFTGNYSADLAFLNSFKVNSNYVEIINSYYGFTSTIEAFKDGYVTIVVWSIIIVFLVLCFLISMNLFYANVKSMEKNLGILKAMGSSKEETMFIVGLQALVISIIEFIFTIVGILIFSMIFNNYVRISLLNLNMSLVSYLLLILVVFALLVSLLASRKALLSRPINVIENK